jgi:hypothetical protein
MSSRFDPRQHLRTLENGQPYLDVKWRLHWLRSEHPDAVIETQLVSLDGDTAVCKATVRVPDGGSATGHASATRTPGRTLDHIEQAETRAIGRALAALGYGTQFTEEDAIATRAGERPVSLVPSQPPAPARVRPIRDDDDDEPEPEPPRPPRDGRTPDEAREARPVREVHGDREGVDIPDAEQQDDQSPAEPVPLKRGADLRGRSATETRGGETLAREDVSWTKFWEWAKRRGYRDANHLRDLLGIDVNALTPAEVRERIRRYELDNPPPGSDES